MGKINTVSRAHDFEPNISAKKCSLYTSFYVSYTSISISDTKCPLLVKNSEDEITNLGSPQTFCHHNQFSVEVDHQNIYFLEHCYRS